MLTTHDAEYLQQYLFICEQFTGCKIQLGELTHYNYDTHLMEDIEPDSNSARGKLKAHNQQYALLVSPGVLRNDIIATVLADDNDGWATSAIC